MFKRASPPSLKTLKAKKEPSVSALLLRWFSPKSSVDPDFPDPRYLSDTESDELDELSESSHSFPSLNVSGEDMRPQNNTSQLPESFEGLVHVLSDIFGDSILGQDEGSTSTQHLTDYSSDGSFTDYGDLSAELSAELSADFIVVSEKKEKPVDFTTYTQRIEELMRNSGWPENIQVDTNNKRIRFSFKDREQAANSTLTLTMLFSEIEGCTLPGSDFDHELKHTSSPVCFHHIFSTAYPLCIFYTNTASLEAIVAALEAKAATTPYLATFDEESSRSGPLTCSLF